MSDYCYTIRSAELYHHGVRGMRWGVRNKLIEAPTRLAKGYNDYRVKRYSKGIDKWSKRADKYSKIPNPVHAFAKYKVSVKQLRKEEREGIAQAHQYVLDNHTFYDKKVSAIEKDLVNNGPKYIKALNEFLNNGKDGDD